MDALTNIKYFKPLSDFKKFNLNFKGLYALRVKNISVLPTLFKVELNSMKSTLIYIGKGERTLYQRLLEECYGKGNGTFFRGIGALLDFKPQKGSLIGMKNKNNYRFSENDRDEIVKWMHTNLDFNFVKIETDIEAVEKEIIGIHCPILNSKHNPCHSKMLAKLREDCRKYALST